VTCVSEFYFLCGSYCDFSHNLLFVASLITAYPSGQTLMYLREDTFNEMVGSREQCIKILGIESCKTKNLAVYQWWTIVEVVKP